MLSEKEFRDKNCGKQIIKIKLPKNTYVQAKSGKDTHFISIDDNDDDNFILIAY